MPEQLTHEQKQKITREVSLGVAAPAHESEAARHWRQLMQQQIDHNIDHHVMNDQPWDIRDYD